MVVLASVAFVLLLRAGAFLKISAYWAETTGRNEEMHLANLGRTGRVHGPGSPFGGLLGRVYVLIDLVCTAIIQYII